MKKTNRTTSCLLDRTTERQPEGFGKASEMFGEYKSLEKSDEFLDGKHPETQRFWTVYSKEDNVTVLDHLKEDL